MYSKFLSSIILFAFSFSFALSFASDHIDGPITTKHRVTDLTDLYAFPTPNNKDSLTLVLNAYPFVPSDGHFPERVNYDFVIRKAELFPKEDKKIKTSDETTISCSFIAPHNMKNHRVTCKTSNGLSATSKVDSLISTGDFKLYSGMRSDPFFFNLDWFKSVVEDGVIPTPKRENSMELLNVLSIVIDIDTSKLKGGEGHSVFAVTATSSTQDSPSDRFRQLDFIGRPEITNVSMFASDNEELRDQYNRERPFKMSSTTKYKYKQRLTKNIKYYDGLDNKTDWSKANLDKLVSLLVDDYLLVDVSAPCKSDNFLEIEISLLNGNKHNTCGGRKLTDDIMDTLFSRYVNAGRRPKLSDGADRAQKKVSDNFPYLASPDKSFKAFVARKLN